MRSFQKTALEYASSAVELNPQGHFIFVALMALGTLARATSNPTEADDYIAEDEAVLNQGSKGLGLDRNGPEMLEHHAEASSTFIVDALPAWATFHIQRCLLLSKIASRHANDAAKTKLSGLLKV